MNTVCMNTSELSGAALDYATALAVGHIPHIMEYGYSGEAYYVEVEGKDFAGHTTLYGFDPSSDWSHGGPLIEKYWMVVNHEFDRFAEAKRSKLKGFAWAHIRSEGILVWGMRAIVAAGLGDSIEVPEVLVSHAS